MAGKGLSSMIKDINPLPDDRRNWDDEYSIVICLFTFSAHFFYLSAAQNASPAGGSPAGDAFYAADK